MRDLLRRLNRLEASIPPPSTGPCPRCQDWEPTAWVNDWRTDRPAPWHREDGGFYCPACGRPPPHGIVAYVTNWRELNEPA